MKDNSLHLQNIIYLLKIGFNLECMVLCIRYLSVKVLEAPFIYYTGSFDILMICSSKLASFTKSF